VRITAPNAVLIVCNPGFVIPRYLVSRSLCSDLGDATSAQHSQRSIAVAAPGSGKPAEEKAGKLQIPANPEGQLAYATNKATASPGAVTIEMPNMSGVMHNIAIESGTGGATAAGKPLLGHSQFVTKGTATVTVNLKPGTYTFFCQAPGHRAAGMYGTLTVK